MPADLHLHTTASDGSWAPVQVITKAIELGLSAIAITDHDTIDGIASVDRSRFPQLDIFTGIEFSTEYQGSEVHILGYGINLDNTELLQILKQLEAERWERAYAMVEKLNQLGCFIDFEQVQKLAGTGVIGRVHLAQALMESGYTASIQESFRRFLVFGAPAYVSRKKLSCGQAVELIRAAGGAAVLAHPGLIRNRDVVLDVIGIGIDGLEVIHSNHNSDQVREFSQIAERFNLLSTGGSDCHGPKGKDEVLIGRCLIPDQWVESLRAHLSKS